MWNIDFETKQADRVVRSPVQFIPVCEEFFGVRPIRILEIGVFRGGLSERFRNSSLNICSYTGVDPYLGNSSDSYTGAYWNNESEADRMCRETAAKFSLWGFTLLRMTSQEFFRSHGNMPAFDLIYVDGDHRYQPALWDLLTAFPKVSPEGLLAVDDYANVDTPDVTRAFNAFCHVHLRNIRRMGFVENSFINRDKYVPVVQRTVFIQPVEEEKRIAIATPSEMDGPPRRVSTVGRLLDLSPRKILHRVRRLLK